ncbi:MAG TPA: NAD(P)/FAD-dependent oxidoreductase [Verrucomicrobiae bacterium]|jgi:flavin-dependent dehydrogenase|nr:NAD(P)/FAD-dependent oxidoreductase [Verrucomicrobiae bacterium]
MYSCDVLIAGGGPAGSSCAWALRSSGLRVVVVDKSVFPRNKICGGWITPPVLQALAIDPTDYARGRTFQPITAFRIGCMGQKEVDVPYTEAISYGIRRCEFDDYLLRRSGAEIKDGVAIASIERSGKDWIINGEIKARLLVGAGGHFCPVSRFLGKSTLDVPVVAQEVEFELTDGQAASCGIAGDAPELYFCRDLQGYGWCFRKGNFLNIGLGRLDQHSLPEHVTQFMAFLRAAGKLGFDPPNKMGGHAYLLYGHSRRKLVDDSVMLIGDAAGLAYAQSGEGIRPAVESGLIAATAIKSADGAYSRERLQAYATLLADRLGDGRNRNETLASRIPRGVRNGIARLLLKSEWFCRRTVVESWFLHMHDSALTPGERPLMISPLPAV